MENYKYERDVCFQYTGEDSVPADIKDVVHYDGTNLIIDNKVACLGWYVAYNKLSADVIDMDSLIIRSVNEWKNKGLFDVESASSGNTVATPKFAPVGGNIDKYGKVAITCSTDGATIYYTIDGTDPSKDNGTEYTAEIEITTDVTLKAIAYGTDEEGNEIVSSIASATYSVVMPTCATPKASATGSVPAGTKVTLSCDTPGAKIYYTVDGSVPANGVGTLYADEDIEVTDGMTLKAIAVKADYNNSAVFSTKYTVVKPTVAKPVITPASGEVESGTKVTITCGTDDATIYYTTDGSTPSASSTEYTTEIEVTSAMTIKAIAIKTDYNNSPVASASYTVKAPEVYYYAGWILASDDDENELPFPNPVTQDDILGMDDLISDKAVKKELGESGNEMKFPFTKWETHIGHLVYAYPKSLGEVTSCITNGITQTNVYDSFSRTDTVINGVDYWVYYLTDPAYPEVASYAFY